MVQTKQRHTYLPYTFPAVAGTHLPTTIGCVAVDENAVDDFDVFACQRRVLLS